MKNTSKMVLIAHLLINTNFLMIIKESNAIMGLIILQSLKNWFQSDK